MDVIVKRILFLIVLLVGLTIRIILALTKPEVLWIDDSFYSLGIARNIALGRGWTHDGFHVTNGFQPLYVFIMVPFYWVLPAYGRLVPVLSLVMGAFLNVATGWLLFRLIDSLVGERGALLSLIAWCLSPYVISSVNGLETPIQVFLLVLVASLYLTSWRSTLIGVGAQPSRRTLVVLSLGFLLGLLMLTRVDSLVFAAALLFDLTLKGFWHLRRDKERWLGFVWTVGLVGLVLLLTQLPWLAASMVHTGRLAFDSGIANRQRCIAEYTGDNIFLDHFFGLIPYLQLRTATAFLPWSAMVSTGLFFVSLLVVIGVYVVAYRGGAVSQKASLAVDLLFLWLYSVGLMAVYVFYQFTIWNWPRYFYPLCIVGLILLSIWIETLYRSLRSVSFGKLSLGSIVYALTCLGFVAALPFSLPSDVNPLTTNSEDWFTKTQYDAADWLAQNLPADARVGAFQSGILGYFSDRQVVNLDGVVNYTVLPYYLNRDIALYLVIEDIGYLVDWSLFTGQVDFDEADLNAMTVMTFGGTNDVKVIALSSVD